MNQGIHSTIQSLHARLLHRWCPKWFEAFSDQDLGGFYERLGKGFQPILMGQRRLVTQCRQLSIYSHISLNGNKDFQRYIKEKFEFILSRYHDPKTGLWHFALDDAGNVKDRDCDLYALAFVIFSFSHYYCATKDERAKKAAADVLNLILTKFRVSGQSGYVEALSGEGVPLPRMRRQNPHMHLLEACLFAYETWQDQAYQSVADEMVSLFDEFFFDSDNDALYEFMTSGLDPHPDKREHLEPGHYFEWVWLLKKHAIMKGRADMHDKICMQLLSFANKHGWDSLYGGIFDTVDGNGRLVADSKRIWPFCEALKANALMLNAAEDRQAIKDRVGEMVQIFETKYMQERGFWTEWLNRNLTPAADYMPGTTPYHVYFGIMETWDILERRGKSRSFAGMVFSKLYHLRRRISHLIRKIKRSFISFGSV